MKFLLTLIIFTASFLSFSQTPTELLIPSKLLEGDRNVTVTLPASYDTTNRTYPVVYCLDGEYTGGVVSGLLQFNSFRGAGPECIVVSIPQNFIKPGKQGFYRWYDCAYVWETGALKESGKQFKDFLELELIPFMESNYRTAPYKALIGHSFTANYVNYFLLEESPTFNSLVAMSPYYASAVYEDLEQKIKDLNTSVNYFVAYGENDLSGHITSVKEFDKQFGKLDVSNFRYELFDLKGNQATHYTIFTKAMPFALEHIFPNYGSFTEKEIDKVLNIDDKIGYIQNRIKTTNYLYGDNKRLTEDMVWDIGYCMEKKKQWEQLKQLGDWYIKENPKHVTGYYVLGGYYENQKDYAKALEYFEKGYNLLGDEVTNKNDFYEDVERMQKKVEK